MTANTWLAEAAIAADKKVYMVPWMTQVCQPNKIDTATFVHAHKIEWLRHAAVPSVDEAEETPRFRRNWPLAAPPDRGTVSEQRFKPASTSGLP